MKYLSFIFLSFGIFFVGTAAGQETQDRVVDEVVAVVNEGVITLSKVKRESKAIIDAGVQQGGKREELERDVENKRGELITNLIYEELLAQKAKELGLERQVDEAINRRFADILKQYNLKTLEELYQQMERTGTSPEEIRDMWRKQVTRDLVIQKEVQMKLYWGAGSKELKDYYEKHKAKFTKPETITLSEIFLGFAGRDEATVREKAKQLVAQLRSGADFNKLMQENSDPGPLSQGRASMKFPVSELSDLLRTAVKGVKVGGVTDPIAADQVGMLILRVDAREQASSESFFDENAVRLALMQEKEPEERKKFLASLRADSYIKIGDTYRPIVSPLLFADDRQEKPQPAKEKSGTKNN